MVHFNVIDDEVIYISRINQLLYMVYQVIKMTFLDRIKQGNLLVLYQEGPFGRMLSAE
jgi:hypothetical protein